MADPEAEIKEWWRTSIIDMEPGKISFWKHPIEELIGNVSFPQMIWLMLRGDLPSLDETKLLEAALVGGVDHGPQAPSIAAARMAATCGVGLNNVLATGINMLGDVHGGAGEQCAELYFDIRDRFETGLSMESATQEGIKSWREKYGKIIKNVMNRVQVCPFGLIFRQDGAMVSRNPLDCLRPFKIQNSKKKRTNAKNAPGVRYHFMEASFGWLGVSSLAIDGY